jgi:hypothetical protein
VLPAVRDADDGAIHHFDGVRTSRAVVIVVVAAWSSRCRGPGGALRDRDTSDDEEH